MKKGLEAVKLGIPSKKAFEITKFYGIDHTRLEDGMLLDGKNVTVLSGGALCSVLKEAQIDVSGHSSIEGVYTFCEDCDAEYEKTVTPEWVFENICPESILSYKDWQKNCSRIMIKDIGMPPKNDTGYREVISAFSDGENTYVFYEARYHMIDERRQGEFSAIGSALAWTFYSGEDGDYTGEVNICQLIQVFLDVIGDRGVETSLVDARIDILDSITDSRYSYSRMISTDKKNYKYVSVEYSPTVGENYKIYPDRVYTDIYSVLDTDYESEYAITLSKKRFVRYCNVQGGNGEFDSAGEKMLLLPDMRLIDRLNKKWIFSAATSGTMPKMSAAVQHFDRLYGIYDDTVYVSVKGNCTDFTEAVENEPASGGWKMITTDVGGFTAIAAFDGKVAVFTGKSMLTVRGTELPFTLSHEADCGCFSQDAVTVCEGALYFVSEKGIMRYSGSSMKCISDGLPRDTDYSMVTLSAAGGVLVAALGGIGQLWIYESSSEQWSRLSLEGEDFVLAGENAAVRTANSFVFYKLFEDFGEFSFKLALKNQGRRRVKSITLTADVGVDAELCIYDKRGNVLMSVYSPDEQPVSRTFYPRGMYIDHGELLFGGYGDVTLYGIRIEYASLVSSARKIK